MSQPLASAGAALICYGLSDFVYKRAAGAGIRADHFPMTQAWFYCPLVILYAFATHTFGPAAAASWGLLAGAFAFAGSPPAR
jgi:hypothetical protein